MVDVGGGGVGGGGIGGVGRGNGGFGILSQKLPNILKIIGLSIVIF